MEFTEENLNLLHKIRPPNLEDAGLEDCALPPDSIHQAFLKAATAVGSRAATILAGKDDISDASTCVDDPWGEIPAPKDDLVGIEPEIKPPGPCATVKGGGLVGNGESTKDVVVVGERNEEDEVVVVDGGECGEGGDCVDGLRGLEIKEKDEERENDDEHGEKKPTLVEGYFFNP
ncbi:hypothetical protein BVRB_9g220880 [Beta vulgaris subsp. vulgaris]|uniref:uncharacterized protein LOC104904680 n=1 Tax=Beta vulgaris subsp. vulgaris TaxID=3555 RepID=UPI0005400389|nr:uncharacterized protein LOC104904680 [Beta vulgaris subsp. vulgaris]KMT00812.1 hypothetical protein BVRB_9g220880 [Beta vulgaris subsp. vulgaris]